jgi:NADPH-dependent curcumin reductase CurA
MQMRGRTYRDGLQVGDVMAGFTISEVVDGLEAAPGARIDVLAGRNVGKRMVRVGEDPARR